MEQQRQTGKLMTYRAAKRSKTGAFVFGFPLSEAGLSQSIQKICPPPATAQSRKRDMQAEMVEVDTVIEHIQEACGTVWPLNRIRTVGCHDWEDGYTPVVALVACDRPNSDHLPQDDQLERLKKIMAGEGFEDGPAWFLIA